MAYKADKKVARAMEHAMKHGAGRLEHALPAGGVATAAVLLESAHLSGGHPACSRGGHTMQQHSNSCGATHSFAAAVLDNPLRIGVQTAALCKAITTTEQSLREAVNEHTRQHLPDIAASLFLLQLMMRSTSPMQLPRLHT